MAICKYLPGPRVHPAILVTVMRKPITLSHGRQGSKNAIDFFFTRILTMDSFLIPFLLKKGCYNNTLIVYITV